MPRKARSDASVGSALNSTHKRLKLGSRYKVVILDRQNGNRRVRSDASLGSLRTKAKKSA